MKSKNSFYAGVTFVFILMIWSAGYFYIGFRSGSSKVSFNLISYHVGASSLVVSTYYLFSLIHQKGNNLKRLMLSYIIFEVAIICWGLFKLSHNGSLQILSALSLFVFFLPIIILDTSGLEGEKISDFARFLGLSYLLNLPFISIVSFVLYRRLL